MSSLTFGVATVNTTVGIRRNPTLTKNRISCVAWDPEGILGAQQPAGGHIARLEFKRRLEKDVDAKEAFVREIREEKERRQALRQSRVIPETDGKLIEYFLDTEAQDIEFEIARLRQRLDKKFFSEIQLEIGKIRFAVSKTQDMEDRLIELEALKSALQEGTEAYDKMQADLITTKQSLTKLFTSQDIKSTILDMVERNEVNRSLLTLLDENIANAHKSNQKQAADYMETVRSIVLKYLTV